MKLSDSYARLKARRPGLDAAEAEIALSEAIANFIVDARVRAEMTQAELARRAGTTQARISELEHGEANPTVETLARVAGALAPYIEMATFLSLIGTTTIVSSHGHFVVVPEAPSRLVSKTSEPTTAPTAVSSMVFAAPYDWVREDVELEMLVAGADSNLAQAA